MSAHARARRRNPGYPKDITRRIQRAEGPQLTPGATAPAAAARLDS